MCKRSKHPQTTGINTKFSEGTYWDTRYQNYLHKRTSATQELDWNVISEYHTDMIRKLQGCAENEVKITLLKRNSQTL